MQEERYDYDGQYDADDGDDDDDDVEEGRVTCKGRHNSAATASCNLARCALFKDVRGQNNGFSLQVRIQLKLVT